MFLVISSLVTSHPYKYNVQLRPQAGTAIVQRGHSSSSIPHPVRFPEREIWLGSTRETSKVIVGTYIYTVLCSKMNLGCSGWQWRRLIAPWETDLNIHIHIHREEEEAWIEHCWQPCFGSWFLSLTFHSSLEDMKLRNGFIHIWATTWLPTPCPELHLLYFVSKHTYIFSKFEYICYDYDLD